MKDFTRRIGYDLPDSMERLKKAGISFDNEEQTLKEIARINRLSPQQVYLAIKPLTKEAGLASNMPEVLAKETGKQPLAETPVTATPSGLGKKTVTGVCEAYGIDQEEAIKKLAAKGIAANPGDKIKNLAEKYGKLPLDIYEIMK